MRIRIHLLIATVALSVAVPRVFAQGSMFTYQGRLNDGTNLANGSYEILFRPFGVASGGSQLTLPNIRFVSISNGLFTTTLDLGTAIFDGGAVYLQLEVRTNGGAGYTILSPRQQLTPAPYSTFAAQAATVPNGAIGSEQLANTIDLGTTNLNGRLDVYRTASGAPAISLVGAASQISTYGDTAQEQTRLQANSYGGRLTTRDEAGSVTTLIGSATNAGGVIQAYQANGNIGVAIDGDATGTSGGGQVRVRAGDGSLALNVSAADRQVNAYGSDGQEKVQITSSVWGAIYLNNGRPSNDRSVTIGSQTINGGGYLGLANTNGSTRISMEGQGPDAGGVMYVSDRNGFTTVELNGASSAGNAGQLLLKRADGTVTMNLSGAESTTAGSQLLLRQANGTKTVELDGEVNTGGGGLLRLYKGDGTTAITLQADSSGEGKITTQVLQITGGSDLSEQFEIETSEGELKPGTIVCIDSANPGHLIPSTQAYDQTVAGIVSGAGGVKPGMLMGQQGTAADGKHPVALSGRVYCLVDASQSAIHPGDLITTSDTPGHGMKAQNQRKARGAIIGKAMSSLEKGKGLVLVLVSLQ